MYVQWVMGSYNLWLTALWYLIRIAKNAPLGVLRARICVLRKTCGTVRAVDVCGAFPRRIRAPRRLYPRKAGFGIWSQLTLATMQNTWQKIENWFDFQKSNFTDDFRYLFFLRAQFHWVSASSIFVLSKYEMATMSTHLLGFCFCWCVLLRRRHCVVSTLCFSPTDYVRHLQLICHKEATGIQC